MLFPPGGWRCRSGTRFCELMVLLVFGSGVAVSWATDAPAAAYNLPGQARTRTCVPLRGEQVPLRFADGTPTGWFVRADDPSQQGSRQGPCGVGTMELDLHEVLTNASGMKLYFHPGGGPTLYHDYVQNGQYGHIALEELQPPPEPKGDLNGKPAPVGPVSYYITPTRIPLDLWYKPNVSHGHSGSTYYTYGNPGYDKTRGRGDWTYINWSWVQNGGAIYPENKCAGGGMVRALGKRDARFDACRVEPIIGYSYGADNLVNGRVTAIYGRTFVGPGEGGSEVYGWLVYSYQTNGGLIVPCVRRAEVTASAGSEGSSSTNRLERMAWNLLHPRPPQAQWRQELMQRMASEKNPMGRMELMTELARMDEPATVAALLELVAREKDPRVREQAIVLLGFLASTARELGRVTGALSQSYGRGDEGERVRLLEVVSNFAAPEAVQWMAARWRAGASQAERLAAADGILKLAPRVKVEETLVRDAQQVKGHSKIAVGDAE